MEKELGKREDKINWLSILQGWSMLLVIVGHISLTNEFQDPRYPLNAIIETTIYSFHMPLFMFISGMLLYHTKISKNRSYVSVISDKVKRLGVPMLFFTIMTALLKMAFNPLMKRPVSFSFTEIINYFLYPGTNPLGEMWFVVALLIVFMFYPLYTWSLADNKKMTFTLIGLLILNLSFPKDIHFLCISSAAYMLFFFYLGILTYSKKWILQLLSLKALCILSLIFIFTNIVINIPIVSVLVGIAFSASLCMNINKVFPSCFRSFRDYTFQIFLMGIFFQMAVRFIYSRLNLEILYIPLYFLSIFLALYLPVLMSMIILKLKNRLLCMCFGLRVSTR